MNRNALNGQIKKLEHLFVPATNVAFNGTRLSFFIPFNNHQQAHFILP